MTHEEAAVEHERQGAVHSSMHLCLREGRLAVFLRWFVGVLKLCQTVSMSVGDACEAAG